MKKNDDEEFPENEEDDDEDKEHLDQVEMKELEKLINSKHTNYSKISDHYKLCEVVSKANPE